MASEGQGIQTAQRQFVDMVPEIQCRARITFRHLNPEAKEEAVAEVLAMCWQNHMQCILRGKAVPASSLAHYATKSLKSGRALCGQNSTDVLAPRTKLRGRATVERLNVSADGWWDRSEALEDRRTWEQPYERVRIKHDYGAFLHRPEVTDQEREVFNLLAEGHRTGEIAGQLDVSAPRVCQIKGAIGLKLEGFMGPDIRPGRLCAGMGNASGGGMHEAGT